jgi:hypothetical protein
MSSAFQFINEKQLPDKSEPSSSTKANTPKTGANDGIIASSASKATPKLDKSKPLSFDSGSTLSFGSDKQTSSSFAFLNKPAVVNADPDKDKASNLDFGFGAPANKPVSTQPANTGSGGFGSLSIRPTSFGGFGQSKRANTRTEGSFGTIQPLPATTDKEKPITQPRKTLLGQKSKFGTPVNNQPRQTFSGFGSKPSQPLVSLTFGSIKPFPLSLSQKPAPSQQSQQAIISSPSPNTTTASTPTATEGSKVSTTTSPEQSSPLSSNTTNTSTATLDANKTKTNFSSSFNTKDKLVAQSQASLVAASASTSTTQAVPNNYASLLEEIADNDALDQPQRSQSVPASNTNKTMTDRLSCSETNLTDASHSAFPFINDGGSKSVFSDKPPFTLYKWIDNEPPKTSAFGFINQGSPTLSGSFDFSVASIQSHLSDMFSKFLLLVLDMYKYNIYYILYIVFGSPPTSTSPAPVTFSSSILHSEKDSETKLLSANTSWRTFQINKQKELDIIQGLYNKESQTQDMVKQVKR